VKSVTIGSDQPNLQTKKIQVGGMSQSGSTLCFNLVRLLLEQSKLHEYKYILTKDHRKVPDQDFYIVTIRDIRDTTASYYRKYKKQMSMDLFDLQLKSARKNILYLDSYGTLKSNCLLPCCVNTKVILLWKYELYKSKPHMVLNRMTKFLKLESLSEHTINFILNHAEGLINKAPSKSFNDLNFYQKTYMTQDNRTNHGIVGSYDETLPRNFIEKLNIDYRDWLLKYGYDV